MKKSLLFGAYAISSLCLTQVTQAALSLEIQVGTLLDSTSATISDSAIWAVIVDEDANGTLPGGLSVSTSGTLTTANAAQINTDFSGVTIDVNEIINGDMIFKVYMVDGVNTSGLEGLSIQSMIFSDTEWQAIGGKNWAIYWFPTLTTASNTLPTGSNFEVGAIRETSAGSGGTINMQFPAFVDEANPDYTAAFLDDSVDVGGDIPVSSFAAVAIPEPSAWLLSLLGVPALMRRKRA